MTNTVSYPSRQLPVREVDVLVAGGGPAGVAAAIGAAREGARTLLIEQSYCLGGMGTLGLVPCFVYINDGDTLVTAGLAASIIDEMKADMPHIPAEQYDWVAIDPELLKRIYDRRVVEAGTEILFHTQLIDVLPAAGHAPGGNLRRVSHAVIANKAGISAVAARVFIDCTGDGDLAALAGADYEKGDEQTGEVQPATMCFMLTGVDAARFFAWRDELPGRQRSKDAIARARAAGDLDIPEPQITAVKHVSPSTLGLNFSHLFDVDGTDPRQLSAKLVEGRRQVRQLADFLVKYCPGCENGFLAATAALGVRETRRIVGEYRLTIDDYVARRSFDDEIARNNYYIDVHMDKAGQQAYAAGKRDFDSELQPYGPGESHGIPYRCLMPKKLANVLVAGRCISADRPLHGATRCMPHCMSMGEAAGCAAATAARSGQDIRQIDVQSLRARLRKWGAYLP